MCTKGCGLKLTETVHIMPDMFIGCMFLGMPICGAMCIWLPIGIMPGCMGGLLKPIMLFGTPTACKQLISHCIASSSGDLAHVVIYVLVQ